MTPFNFRLLALSGFLACAAAMAVALWIQSMGYQPCPLCVFQRVAMIGTGLFFLLAAVLGPRGRGRWWVSLPAALCAMAGAGIAGRHVWLQHLPADQVPACGPSLDYLMDVLPWTEVVSTILRGDGNCAKVDLAFLGLALPAWTFIAFAGLGLLALLMPRLSRRRPDLLL